MDELDVFIGVMDLNEAKTHQLRLKAQGIMVSLKSNDQTCTTGCKVTVEVWGPEVEKERLQIYFRDEFLKNIKGHVPNFDHMGAVFDPQMAEVICQACGMKFAPTLSECPDCGLVYS